MDNNKSRDDLLAAGRKKLQQFRKKKDNKGNNSKSSGKGGKSGRDRKADTVAEAAVTEQNVPDVVLSKHDASETVDFSESSSGVVAEAIDTATAISEHDVIGGTSNDTAVEQQNDADGERFKHDAEDTTALPDSVSRVDTVASDAASRVDSVTSDSPVADKDPSGKGKVGIACLLDAAGFPSEGSGMDNTSNGNDVYITASLEDGSSSLVLEDTSINIPAMVLEEMSEDSSLRLPTDFSSGLEREHVEEQEVGCSFSSGNQMDDRMANLLDGDSIPPSNDTTESITDSREVDSGNTFDEENISAATQLNKIDSASLAVSVTNYAGEGEEAHGHSFGTSPLTESSLASTIRSATMSQERDGTSFGSNDEKAEAVSVSDTEGTQASSGFVEVERSYEVENRDTANVLACKHVDLSSILNGSLVKLSQLAEILQLLDQDEFRYIFASRESSVEKPRNADETTAKEIVQCRNELQEVVSEKVELENQLQLSRAEAEVFADKVNELQNKLEIKQGEMSTIFSELVDCRNLVKALQSENVNLNESFKVMTEEKNKLSQESRNFLLENEKITEELYQHKVSLESLQNLIHDDRKRLEQENSGMISENGKLLADLAECQDTVEVLRLENKNINEILASLSEERKNLDEEKVSMYHQFGRMSEELINCKELILTLQTEIITLNERITSICDEKNKLEEEQKTIFREYEKQYHELVEFKVLEAVLQAECCKAVNDLKEARTSIKHHTEEKKSLCADLEFLKFKIKEFDCEKISSQFDEVASQALKNDSGALHEHKSYQSSGEQTKLDIYNDSFGFLSLKRNLEEAGVLVQKLEREIDRMHLDSSSLSRSMDDVSPGVSQLSHTFEPKGYTYKDDQDSDISPSSEGRTTEDSCVRTKMFAQNLKILLKELVNDAEDASEFFRGMQSKLLSNASGTELSKYYTASKEHNDQVQEANIELMVVYEAMRELIHHVVAIENELLGLCDTMQKQEAVLKSENHHLLEKVNAFQAHINELQVHLEGHCRDSDEMASSISNQLQVLQSEVADRELILQEEQSSVSAQILQTVGLLDSTTKNISGNPFPSGNSNSDIVGCVAASVDGARKVIGGLHGQLEAAQKDFHEMEHKTNVALSILHRLYSELMRTLFGYYPDAADEVVADDKKLDLLHPNFFDDLLDQLKNLYSEKLELESANKQLSSQMTDTAREIDELQKLCLKSDTVLKLIGKIEQSVTLERPAMCEDEPALLLESLIHLLVQKCRETGQDSSLCVSLEMQLHDLQDEVECLNLSLMEYRNENLVFKHSLKSAQEIIIALNSKVNEKVAELELSEQRISSLREKLGIAVTKGKGLISQRESLKQSLAEMSKELEKCSQELLSKDERLHELETNVKVYSEAGERMEALESELSYIRNSATALRESFLLKDSVLLRIEEILNDLELPENFHSKDIIEKIDWLAKIVGSHSLPLGEWDHRRSAERNSYSDAGFGGSDGSKEDMQPIPTSAEDLRRRYEELQNRFYGLAEQNEMLEQSLMERNNLVQRWEEILDRVDMPSHLRSVESDDKIQWLGNALSEAQNHSYSLQQKIDNLETFCGSLSTDVEDSKRRAAELETAFQQACAEKEILAKDLEMLRQDSDESIKRIADFSLRNENLQNESSSLQAQKLHLEEDKDRIEGAIRRLKEIVNDALQDSCPEDVELDQEGVEYFEEMIRKLVEKHKTLLSEKLVSVDSTDVHATGKGELSNTSRDFEEPDVSTLSKKLDECMGELMSLKEEKDRYMQTNQSLVCELEGLEVKKKELEELLNQEERKSASLREKLNVAVRKGKSLVQQRDVMKQSIEELNAEVERLKSETKDTEKTISEFEEQIKNLFAARDRVQEAESENSFLRDRLAETERYMQEKEHSWSSISNALGEINVGFEFHSVNPVERIKEIGKLVHDLHGRMDSLEQESRKSKRAAELLLAELNEVQERNDGLQDELAKVVNELSEVSREKEIAENAKHEAIAHFEKLSYLQSEEKERQMSEITVLKSGVDNMKNDLSSIDRELGDVLSKDLEVLYNVKATMKSFFDFDGVPALGALFPGSLPGGTLSAKSENKVK
ncbi:golgin subfamily B member 1-like [Salvia hispanica]|uniref:golgin subfamily B member 1-like n=1 Tax=Salvia hispanica TaxID=49212 RepID=UPI0020097D91|nr:golgin subfamily B member 1-like [Salvia hispanica]